MIVYRLPYILHRSYPNFGYLTDNRNFGYDNASKSCLKVGDMILSSIGDIFYSILSDKPQSIDDVVKQLGELFADIPTSVIKKDGIAFYKKLHAAGFVYYGDERKLSSEQYFSYKITSSSECKNASEKVNQNVYEETFGNRPRLTRVHIDISSRCNENCIHCYIPSYKKCSIMTTEMFDNILVQCVDLNVLNITISGGEPMLNPNLGDFLLKCKEYNFSVNLLSNLTLLSEDLIEIIASNPLVSVQTSVYAMSEAIHDAITNQKGSFQKTLHAINKLYERNVPLQINCPIMKQNQNFYKDVLDFAKSKNIAADADCSLYGCYDGSKRNLSCRLKYDEISKIVKAEFSSIQKSKNYIEQIQSKRTDECDFICPVCKNSLCISNDGKVYPCEGWQSLTIGNLGCHSLRYIWEKAPITNQLRNLKYKDFPQCNLCQDKKYCTICLIMNANENIKGDYKNVNPFQCEVARIKREQLKKYGYI